MISTEEKEMLHRSELLFGDVVMDRISNTRIIIFGTGGVGSWCAESLIRTGVRHMTLVDSDTVALSNCNRQLMATSRTVGRPKVEVLKERLLEIAPSAEIEALQMFYNAETSESFKLENYDFIIDAIDSLTDKVHLILHATSLPKSIHFYSSMGAALRLDPLKVRASEFWKVQGDALARAIRTKFKKDKVYPKRKFICVHSDETPMKNMKIEFTDTKRQVNGSLSQVTGVFGFTIASLVIKQLMEG